MLISFNSICVKYQRFSLLSQIQMISFRLDALKFENLYKKLLPTISTFSYVSGQTKQACPTVQPIRHTRHNCSFTIRAWTAISKTGLKRSNLNFNSIRHWYQSLLHLSNYIILTYLSNCKRFQLKLVPILCGFIDDLRKRKEDGTKVLASQLFLDCRARRSGWVGSTTLISSAFTALLNCAEVGRRNRILTNYRFLSHSLACRQTISTSNNLSDTKKLKSIVTIRLMQTYSETFCGEKRF